MEKKEVKIIGLKINNQVGILQSCNLKFDIDNRLIAVKGEVGSGKTTLQKSLSLGTQGSDTLKHDKNLYGDIDQEVQLLDEGINVFIGSKTNKKQEIVYSVYTKDDEGNIIKDPVLIGGVKLTPSVYLKSLQTALTWRMDEITSENKTTQRKILLELYKSELTGVGVIFDKTDLGYSESILGRIDMAVNKRIEKDVLRKQNGGYAYLLEDQGIHVDQPETLPKRIDISALDSEKNTISFSIDNVGEVKKQKLKELQNKADAVVIDLKKEDAEISQYNKKLLEDYEKKHQQHKQNIQTKLGVETDLETLAKENCLSPDNYNVIKQELERSFNNPAAMSLPEKQRLKFDESGVCLTTIDTWKDKGAVSVLLTQLSDYKSQYLAINSEPLDSTDSFESNLSEVVEKLRIAKLNNATCDQVDSFTAWSDSDKEVAKLKREYTEMLLSINTGVDGLKINVDKEEGKLDIYLSYDGHYDPEYFGNSEKEQRKLSSYSGTQKPIICLLLQNYLLSKKPKAMRYLWIDNIPIDNKTKELLNKMGDDLGMTVIVNITGDFDKNTLDKGEILIEGGEVFFND